MPALSRTVPVLLAVLAVTLLTPSEAEARRRGGGGWHPEQVLSSIFSLRLSPPPRSLPVRRARRPAAPRAVPRQQMAAAEAPSPAPVPARPATTASPQPAEIASAPLATARPSAAPPVAPAAAPAALATQSSATQSSATSARTAERSTWIDPVR